MANSFVAVAGATGALGKLVTHALLKRGVAVKALVRPNTAPNRTNDLRDAGATIVPIDLSNVQALTHELEGSKCVVSTLQGLKDVMHTTQGNLLDASVAAKVPRFIPSDFSLDFTKTAPGSNRNLDIHREFHDRLNKSGIAWTSILNGGFLDLMAGESPLINHKSRTLPYVGQPDQLLDYTSMVDTAAFTAAVAADPNPTPKFLRIASVTASVQDIADTLTTIYGVQYTPRWMGTIWTAQLMISTMRLFGGENEIFPVWQGMQYMVNMMSGDGKLEPLDNDRYPDIAWDRLEDFLRKHKVQA
ncbi:hypothetical protein N7468_007092 [Penicillium chermesinum]|uniref:NmrA-like domain-containing protein n=1 Tax=Penicillium chermesinum TaxID=63820 RepID=A0A9W9NTF4_9EURO|nr:uncharacterized protein N7468_007092 [Penicillium chermesinum]KAJ5225867.1 hypothetical protein N7468_007092 [Penicillium chermesinum]KAJ6160928.1 hypothetical protein N7470_004324 [Penicillium chermesinum]